MRGYFVSILTTKVPDGLMSAIALAARKNCTSKSEFVRQAILARLEAEGLPFDGTDAAFPDARGEVR